MNLDTAAYLDDGLGLRSKDRCGSARENGDYGSCIRYRISYIAADSAVACALWR